MPSPGRRPSPAGRKKVKNISVDEVTLRALQRAQEHLETTLGFRPTLSQTIQYGVNYIVAERSVPRVPA